jgi:hypothetical protein
LASEQNRDEYQEDNGEMGFLARHVCSSERGPLGLNLAISYEGVLAAAIHC